MSKKLYDDLFHLKYEYYNQNGATYYVDKIMGAVSNYSNLLMNIIPDIIQTWAIVIISMIMIGTISIPLLIFICCVLFLQNKGYQLINSKLGAMSIKLSNVCSRSYSNIVSVFEKVDYVKQLSKSNGLLHMIDKDIKDRYQITADVNVFAGGVSGLLATFVLNVQYAVYIVLGIMTFNGKISSATFIFGTMVINICFTNVRDLVRLSLNMKDANASFDFVENELRSNLEPVGGNDIDSISEISIEGTNIGYEDNILIEDINVSAHEGDHIFLNAETGTGKTSLVKNLVRFYENDGIYINGVPLNRISITKLRSKMVYISQQGAIANGSLEDNIFMGEKYDDDMKKVIASLPFMSKFVENGKIKDMTITDSGSNLSGGDKQKIIVSRLFLQDPDVIILDEITSSMDKETSEIVYESIFNRFNDKIIIIISHVDNVIKYTNKIWRLEKKHIVQSA